MCVWGRGVLRIEVGMGLLLLLLLWVDVMGEKEVRMIEIGGMKIVMKKFWFFFLSCIIGWMLLFFFLG